MAMALIACTSAMTLKWYLGRSDKKLCRQAIEEGRPYQLYVRYISPRNIWAHGRVVPAFVNRVLGQGTVICRKGYRIRHGHGAAKDHQRRGDLYFVMIEGEWIGAYSHFCRFKKDRAINSQYHLC